MIFGIMDFAKETALKASLGVRLAPPDRRRWTGNEGKWSPERLRQIRAEKGVGRPPIPMSQMAYGRYFAALHANAMALLFTSGARNLAEWERKPRPGKRMAAPMPAALCKAQRLPGVTRRQWDAERQKHAQRVA